MSTFKITVDDKEVELKFKQPSMSQHEEAQKVYNKAFKDAITSGALLKTKLDDFAKEQGVWSDESQDKLIAMQSEIAALQRQNDEGGGYLKDAAERCYKIMEIKNDMAELLSGKIELDQMTAEGQASNSRFNYLLTACLVYNDNDKPFYKDVSSYLNSSNVVALEISDRFHNWLNGDEGESEDPPEVAFLKEFNFLDEKGRRINKDGHLVDKDGRLINEEGFYVDKDGNRVDINGNSLSEDGEVNVTRRPFLDDDGNEIKLKTKTEDKAKEVVEDTPEA